MRKVALVSVDIITVLITLEHWIISTKLSLYLHTLEILDIFVSFVQVKNKIWICESIIELFYKKNIMLALS